MLLILLVILYPSDFIGIFMWKRIALALALLLFFKPARVVVPEWMGLTCVSEQICIEQPSDQARAAKLYAEALTYVNTQVGQLVGRPRVLFCSTQACYRRFSFTHSKANAVATLGIVISPQGWQPHFLRHEMIHYLQKERLGNLRGWLLTPEWFMEGMAYEMSGDPRSPLIEPWEGYRQHFRRWYASILPAQLWQQAASL